MSKVNLTEADVKNFSDDELYEKLLDMGGPVGPIVQTTRAFYERRLLKLLKGVIGSDVSEHSEEEEPPPALPPKILGTSTPAPPRPISSPPMSHTYSTSSQKIHQSNTDTIFRQRPTPALSSKREYSLGRDEMYFDPTTLARSSYRLDLRNSSSNSYNKYGAYKGTNLSQITKDDQVKPNKKKKVIIFLVLFITVILIFLIYYNMEGTASNPIEIE